MSVEEATDPTDEEAVRILSEMLGRALMARTIGVSRRTLASWLRGASTPSARSRERVIGALAIWKVIDEVESPEVVRAWFMGMKDALNDYSPAEVIAEGRIDDVAAVARAYVQRS